MHTNSFDEAWTLPSADAARIALRTQQVIAFETNVTQVADPLGGSWFVESLTDQMQREVGVLLEELLELGSGSMLEGCLAAIDSGWFDDHITDAAYAHERAVQRGERIIVGVNAFVDDAPAPAPLNQVGGDVDQRQRERLAKVRRERDGEVVARSLARLRIDALDAEANLMPALMEASRARASVGEIMDTLAEVFGRYHVRAR